MARVRLTQSGFENYTGRIGKVLFVNGVSGDIAELLADGVGENIAANIVAANGTTVIRKAGAAERLAANRLVHVGAPAETIAPVHQSLNPDPLPIKSIEADVYSLQDGDAGYLLNFTDACVVTVSADLDDTFYCSLRQAGEGQVEIVAGSGATVEEIDGYLKTEKRLSIVGITRFPDGVFQVTGRTAE